VLGVTVAKVIRQREQDRIRDPQRESWLVEHKEGQHGRDTAGEDDQAAPQSAEQILARPRLRRDGCRLHAPHDRCVERVELSCIGDGGEQLVQFGGHELAGPQRTRRRLHLASDAVQPRALEGTPERQRRPDAAVMGVAHG